MVRLLSGTCIGITGVILEVESAGASGSPSPIPERLRETAIRSRMALRNATGAELPAKLLIRVAPEDLASHFSTGLDLPSAMAMLGEGENVDRLNGYMLVGELSLEGAMRPIRGALSLAIAARNHGLKGIILPWGNAPEAALVATESFAVHGMRHLSDVIDFARGEDVYSREYPPNAISFIDNSESAPDFADMRGNAPVKRAAEIAAAGGHNLLLVGPPSSGKTMLARRIPSILPPMVLAEAFETTRIYSAAGMMPEREALVTRRPFRCPHRTVSDAGLVGGGQGWPRPGEVSLAHNGVLFLDDVDEFKKHVLESLRPAMEDKRATIWRSSSTVSYSANFMLVAAMNPCPCGGGLTGGKTCGCAPERVKSFRARSQPLRDRLDIQTELAAIPYRDLVKISNAESSANVRARVVAAREIQARRFAGVPRVHTNSQMCPRLVRDYCEAVADADALRIFQTAVAGLGASGSPRARMLKVALTIADLAGSRKILSSHALEAVILTRGFSEI